MKSALIVTGVVALMLIPSCSDTYAPGKTATASNSGRHHVSQRQQVRDQRQIDSDERHRQFIDPVNDMTEGVNSLSRLGDSLRRMGGR